MKLLVRNKVRDYDAWRQVFDADEERARTFGLSVEHVWRSADDAQQVFFVLGLETREGAERFMADPASQDAGERAGVIDGDVWFLE